MASRIEPVRAEGNRRRAQLAVAALGACPAVVVLVVFSVLVHPIVGVVLAVAAGVAVARWAWRSAAPRALAALGAQPAGPELARLHNLVEGLCAIAGVTKPAVLVRGDDRPDSCSLGTDRQSATLVVTTGLIEQLTRVELEGVVAHELAHIKQLDIAPATLIAGLGHSVAGPILRAVLGREKDPSALGREPCADLDGVRLTRYPPGLIAALEKLDAAGTHPHLDDRLDCYPWLSAEERPEDIRFRIDVLREL